MNYKNTTLLDHASLSKAPWLTRHLRYYLQLYGDLLLRGVPLREILLLKYPFRFKDASVPPILSIDLTDACDLHCQYCNNPLFPHPRTMMSQATADAILRQLTEIKINRIRLGGGEPTLHPDFAGISSRLATVTKHLSVVTNGQWTDSAMADKIIRTGFALVEISVDAGGKDSYEKARLNADYGRLLANLHQLKKLRNQHNSRTVLKIRLMLRPSTRHLEAEETMFYSAYCDCILPQHIVKHPESNYATDVFLQSTISEGSIPVCTVPFKDLQIRPDGKVPVCPALGCKLSEQERVFLGNVHDDSLGMMWNSVTMHQLRQAHRTRQGTILETCRNCHYG